MFRHSVAIDKCSHYLKGILTFTVVTDHRPLLGIFLKPLQTNMADVKALKTKEKDLENHVQSVADGFNMFGWHLAVSVIHSYGQAEHS